MSEKFKRIRYSIMLILITFGFWMLILIQIVWRKNLTELQEPITVILWVYLAVVILNVIFLHAIPLLLDYYKKKKDKKHNDNV